MLFGYLLAWLPAAPVAGNDGAALWRVVVLLAQCLTGRTVPAGWSMASAARHQVVNVLIASCEPFR